MEANLKFNLPEDNEELETALYSEQLKQALSNIRAKVTHNMDKEGNTPNQRRQVYAEINNMILEELVSSGVAHIFS